MVTREATPRLDAHRVQVPTLAPPARERSVAGGIGVAAAVAIPLVLAYLLTREAVPILHDRMLPWILGRSMGVAAYLALTAMVATGLWLRHPWRTRIWSPAPESLLRAHVTLAAGTLVLLLAHLISLALDHYAGVGWLGALVPWQSSYRPAAVAIGTLAFYGILLVGGTASLAASFAGKVWYPVHTLAALTFSAALAHGILAGSDGWTLRWLYVSTGIVVAGLQVTRWTARYGSVSSGSQLL
jgi:predicted ferric reductase